MAKSNHNVITYGLSGKVGDLLIFSQRKGKTIVSRVPRRSGTLDSAVVSRNEKFAMAAHYAKSALQDPVLKAGYQAQAEIRDLSAYNVAVADYLNAPKINKVDTEGYFGNAGDKILVQATDDFSLESVTVRIEKADGTLVEEGAAIHSAFHWEYTATAANAALAGCRVTVTAKDLPQNETVKETVL